MKTCAEIRNMTPAECLVYLDATDPALATVCRQFLTAAVTVTQRRRRPARGVGTRLERTQGDRE